MIKKRILSMLVLLAAVATGAWAQTEELLTTITMSGDGIIAYSVSGRATLSTSGLVETGMVAPEVYGWSNSSPLEIGSVTITAAEGYEITKVVFWNYQFMAGYNGDITDTASPFTCYLKGSMRSLNEDMSSGSSGNIGKIEVYGYAAAPAASTYTVTLKEGTEDANKWEIAPAEATTTGVAAGTEVKASYGGVKKVKSVKAVKKAQAWNLTAKLAYTGGEIADFTDATDDLTTMTWAVGEHIAILYEVSGTKKVADAEITAVDGTTGAATITFTVEEGTPDNTACTLVYPYDAAKDDHTGVKDAATLLAAQDGTLSANLDVRVGAGTIQTTTPGLTVTTQPAAQNAIFKFTTKSVPGEGGSLQNTDVTKLTVTIGTQSTQNYVITPTSATSTLYAALPAVSGQTVSFTATDGSNLYAASKSVSFDAAKYYQSTVKMGKVIEVFYPGDPAIFYFVGGDPEYKYLHIGLDQAYAIAKQLSTQNGGATVAVVYNHNEEDVTYALSSDASATARTDDFMDLLNNYRVFLATLWESAW